MNEKFQYNPFDTPEMRIQALTQMLSALSCNALEYVWRPILYAYQWTDEHDMDAITDEDSIRFSLIGAAAHDSPEKVAKLHNYSIYLFHQELRRAHS